MLVGFLLYASLIRANPFFMSLYGMTYLTMRVIFSVAKSLVFVIDHLAQMFILIVPRPSASAI